MQIYYFYEAEQPCTVENCFHELSSYELILRDFSLENFLRIHIHTYVRSRVAAMLNIITQNARPCFLEFKIQRVYFYTFNVGRLIKSKIYNTV